MNRPELSIVIPFLNEERVLPILRDRLEKVRNRQASWELLFVVLTRNFGHQSAVSAGLSFASGKYIGIMDADLQDDPEVLLEMYQFLLKEKFDVIYAMLSAAQMTGYSRMKDCREHVSDRSRGTRRRTDRELSRRIPSPGKSASRFGASILVIIP